VRLAERESGTGARLARAQIGQTSLRIPAVRSRGPRRVASECTLGAKRSRRSTRLSARLAIRAPAGRTAPFSNSVALPIRANAQTPAVRRTDQRVVGWCGGCVDSAARTRALLGFIESVRVRHCLRRPLTCKARARARGPARRGLGLGAPVSGLRATRRPASAAPADPTLFDWVGCPEQRATRHGPRPRAARCGRGASQAPGLRPARVAHVAECGVR